MLRPTYNDLIDSMNKNREEGELEVQSRYSVVMPVQREHVRLLTGMHLWLRRRKTENLFPLQLKKFPRIW